MRRIPLLALVTLGLVACENPTQPARRAESGERVKVASPETGTQTITLVSGNGPIGGRDPRNRVSDDGGVTFHDAFILAPDPEYAQPIPGSQWISGQPVFLGPELILYRRTFALPPALTNATFTIKVHADNVGTIFLNGTQIGQQPFEEIPENFQGPPETFTAPPNVLRAGTNTLAIDVFNFGILTGLDYKATIKITAQRHLDVILRGAGEGAIKFRQPRDADYIVYLRTQVSGLAPNTDFRLQRAVDPVVDGHCTSFDWLTLGRLDAPKVIHTDGQGQGAANFTRDLSGAAGGEFDIRFRVRNVVTGAVVLRSGCYQFKVRQ